MSFINEAAHVIQRFPPGDYEVHSENDCRRGAYSRPWRGTLERWTYGRIPKALFRKSGGVVETFTWRVLYTGDVKAQRVGLGEGEFL